MAIDALYQDQEQFSLYGTQSLEKIVFAQHPLTFIYHRILI